MAAELETVGEDVLDSAVACKHFRAVDLQGIVMLMAKPLSVRHVSDDQVRAMLERYRCPAPFHEVRTRFLGNIASPRMGASPVRVLEDLWGGQLPEFETMDAVNEALGVLVMGFWNQLTRRQERSAPLRLLRRPVATSREGLAEFALMRRQELDGFVEGLFGREESWEFPERARRGFDVLSEMRALFAAALEIVSDADKEASVKDVEITLLNLREMTRITENEIHAVVLACTLARRKMLTTQPANKPTLH